MSSIEVLSNYLLCYCVIIIRFMKVCREYVKESLSILLNGGLQAFRYNIFIHVMFIEVITMFIPFSFSNATSLSSLQVALSRKSPYVQTAHRVSFKFSALFNLFIFDSLPPSPSPFPSPSPEILDIKLCFQRPIMSQ